MKFQRYSLRHSCMLGVTAALNIILLSACSSSDDGPNQGEIGRDPDTSSSGGDGVSPNTKPTGSASGPEAIGDLTGDFVQAPVDSTPVDTGAIDDQCASSSNPTQLKGVTLVFAFDKSFSMGETTTIKSLKWAPVVEATKAFFTNPSTTDVSAQLTLFPSDNAAEGSIVDDMAPADDTSGDMSSGGGMMGGFQGGMGGGFGAGQTDPVVCEEAEYATPDFPLATLPAPAFADFIDNTQPDRYTTPTRWALEGVLAQAEALKETSDTNIAIVLVTDGLPTDCNLGNYPINQVAGVAADAFAAGFPVYVIGVDTPPESSVGGGGDGLANLSEIAESGGTETAFIIDTGDVSATVAQFGQVIETIKESALSCNLPIPEPPAGQMFDKAKVNVNYTLEDGTTSSFVYDETCAAPFAWHYDDSANPTTIILCENNCNQIKDASAVSGSIDIQLGCKTRPSTAL
jgi:hypothetical protein